MIHLDRISKSYPAGRTSVPVVRDVTLRIERGEFAAITGPSGSGKSTLMNIVGLLDRASSGTYHLAGFDVSRLSAEQAAAMRNTTIGFIFQAFHLLPQSRSRRMSRFLCSIVGYHEGSGSQPRPG